MLQKTTALGTVAVLLAGAGTAMWAEPAVERPAAPLAGAEPVARTSHGAAVERRTTALPSHGATRIPAAPGGGAAPTSMRTSMPTIDVAIDEAVREFVLDAAHSAAGASGLRVDDWMPGDVVLRVANGRADLAIACRTPSAGERDRGLVGERLGDLIAVVVVHPSNPLGDLGPDEVRDVVRGAVVNWRQVGGRTSPMHVVLPPPGARSDLFARLLARGDTLAKNATFVPSADERLRMVASDPTAVTVVSLEAARRARVGALRIGGVAPGPGAVRIGRYPFATQVTLVHDGGAAARQIVEGLREPRARRMLGQHLTLDRD